MESPIQGFDFQKRETLGDAQGWNVVAPLALHEASFAALLGGFPIVVRIPDFDFVAPR